MAQAQSGAVARSWTLLTHLEDSRRIYYAAVRVDPQPKAEARTAEIGPSAQVTWCFLLSIPSVGGAHETTERSVPTPIRVFTSDPCFRQEEWNVWKVPAYARA
jgi:hypothetical protein